MEVIVVCFFLSGTQLCSTKELGKNQNSTTLSQKPSWQKLISTFSGFPMATATQIGWARSYQAYIIQSNHFATRQECLITTIILLSNNNRIPSFVRHIFRKKKMFCLPSPLCWFYDGIHFLVSLCSNNIFIITITKAFLPLWLSIAVMYRFYASFCDRRVIWQ